MWVWIKRIGIIFMTLIVAGVWIQVITALRAGRPYYGVTYKGQVLGTYSSLVVLIVATIVGAIWSFKLVLTAYKTWRSK